MIVRGLFDGNIGGVGGVVRLNEVVGRKLAQLTAHRPWGVHRQYGWVIRVNVLCPRSSCLVGIHRRRASSCRGPCL